MAIEVFNRVEKKYFVDEETCKKLNNCLEAYMETDKYCREGKLYSINNIYYDTVNDELIRRSIEKPVYKEKLRLRSYGVPKAGERVFLEIKKKYKGVVNKRRTVIELNQAYDFIDKGILPTEEEYLNSQVVRELDYFIKFYKPVPKLFIKYDRKAMFGREDKNLRITFDRNIITRRTDLRLEAGDSGERLLQDGLVLMEIKSVSGFPLWLTDMLTENQVMPVSFSKYGTEYQKFVLKHT